MVKFLLPFRQIQRFAKNCYRRSNHAAPCKTSVRQYGPANPKILGKFDLVEFYENSCRIRVDFAQKRRFIANDSFKPVC